MPGHNSHKERLMRGMLDEGIVRFGGPFPLKDGTTSVAYVNLRDMLSVPDLYRASVGAYVDTLVYEQLLVGEGKTRYVAGVPEATFGYAGAVADRMAVPLIQRRVKSKGHGIQQNILGRFGAGTEVVLVDDVIKSSLSKTEEAARLHELSEGQITTTGIVVLVDRLQGGRTELERHNLDFAAALTLDGLAQYALDERLGDMTPTLYDDLMAELDPVELAAVRQV